MWKTVMLASAALALAGTTFVQAQRMDGDGPRPMRGADRTQLSADDLAAFTDARVAGIKAGLRLTPEQEKNWPAFEQAYRNFAKLRTDRFLTRRDPAQPPADVAERLQRRADTIGRRADAYKQLAETTAPLYRSLDDGQKRRFTVLVRLTRPEQGRHQFRRGWRGPGQMGPGNMQRDGFGSEQFRRGTFEEPALKGEGGEVERIQYRTPSSEPK